MEYIILAIMGCGAFVSNLQLIPTPKEREAEKRYEEIYRQEHLRRYCMPTMKLFWNHFIPSLCMLFATLPVAGSCICEEPIEPRWVIVYCVFAVIEYLLRWKIQNEFLFSKDGLYISPFKDPPIPYEQIEVLKVRKVVLPFSFDSGSVILKIRCKGKKYFIDFFEKDNRMADLISELMEEQKSSHKSWGADSDWQGEERRKQDFMDTDDLDHSTQSTDDSYRTPGLSKASLASNSVKAQGGEKELEDMEMLEAIGSRTGRTINKSIKKGFGAVGVAVMIVGVCLIVVFGLCTFAFLNIGDEHSDYQTLIENDVPAGAELDAVDKADGLFYGLYNDFGQLSVYDEAGNFLYAYGVPKGFDRGALKFAVSGDYVIIVNREDKAFVYKGKEFVEILDEDDALKKYDIKEYPESYEGTEELEALRPKPNPVFNADTGYIGLFLGIILVIIGRTIYNKREKYSLDNK